MTDSYSGLGNILENHVLPRVREGNLTKHELGMLNDCASQARRILTNSMKIMGKGFVYGEQEEMVGEHFLFDFGHTLIAFAEGIEALVQIERDCEDFHENSEAMKVLYAALQPRDCQEATR